MNRVILERFDSSDQGTFGRLRGAGLSLFTGELPWRDNRPSVSCIPSGIYQCVMTYSPRFRCMMYLLLETGPRSGIRIHPANFMGDAALGYKSQLNGCIALGERMGVMDGQKAVLVSRPAVRRFEAAVRGQPFVMEVRNA